MARQGSERTPDFIIRRFFCRSEIIELLVDKSVDITLAKWE